MTTTIFDNDSKRLLRIPILNIHDLHSYNYSVSKIYSHPKYFHFISLSHYFICNHDRDAFKWKWDTKANGKSFLSENIKREK